MVIKHLFYTFVNVGIIVALAMTGIIQTTFGLLTTIFTMIALVAFIETYQDWKKFKAELA